VAFLIIFITSLGCTEKTNDENQFQNKIKNGPKQIRDSVNRFALMLFIFYYSLFISD
jgi:hypothetical protein